MFKKLTEMFSSAKGRKETGEALKKAEATVGVVRAVHPPANAAADGLLHYTFELTVAPAKDRDDKPWRPSEITLIPLEKKADAKEIAFGTVKSWEVWENGEFTSRPKDERTLEGKQRLHVLVGVSPGFRQGRFRYHLAEFGKIELPEHNLTPPVARNPGLPKGAKPMSVTNLATAAANPSIALVGGKAGIGAPAAPGVTSLTSGVMPPRQTPMMDTPAAPFPPRQVIPPPTPVFPPQPPVATPPPAAVSLPVPAAITPMANFAEFARHSLPPMPPRPEFAPPPPMTPVPEELLTAETLAFEAPEPPRPVVMEPPVAVMEPEPAAPPAPLRLNLAPPPVLIPTHGPSILETTDEDTLIFAEEPVEPLVVATPEEPPAPLAEMMVQDEEMDFANASPEETEMLLRIAEAELTTSVALTPSPPEEFDFPPLPTMSAPLVLPPMPVEEAAPVAVMEFPPIPQEETMPEEEAEVMEFPPMPEEEQAQPPAMMEFPPMPEPTLVPIFAPPPVATPARATPRIAAGPIPIPVLRKPLPSLHNPPTEMRHPSPPVNRAKPVAEEPPPSRAETFAERIARIRQKATVAEEQERKILQEEVVEMAAPINQVYHVVTAAGQMVGPIKAPEIFLLIAKGELTPESLLWHDDFGEWRPAHAVFPGPFPGR